MSAYSHPVVAGFLGLGGPELMIILAVLILLFGAKKLPELAKGIGKSMKEFKKASADEAEEPTEAELKAQLAAAKSELAAKSAKSSEAAGTHGHN